MITYSTVAEIQDAIQDAQKNGKKVGFVPTLGALHNGHMSLIRLARDENDIVVCSIFVNPTQFNEKSDLDKYPRTLDADSKMLEQEHCDILFTPSIDEVYPEKNEIFDFSFDGLDTVMEGAHRPGHFQGVGQVVKRLLDIVTPDRLYMGQKDFQQFTLIAHMIKKLNINTELRIAPIIREEDGLAMSSRNVRLTPLNRKRAPLIYKTLIDFLAHKDILSIAELKSIAMARFEALDDFKPEYFSVVDGNTLMEIDSLDQTNYAVVCTAVWAGEIRLIDNLILKGELENNPKS